MNNLGKEKDNQEIMILNNLQVHSQIKSSIFQSKLQQSIQNIKQLTKPIALQIDPGIQPLNKSEFETPIKISQNLKLSSDDYSTLTKDINIVDFTQNQVQNNSYRNKNSQILKSTDKTRIFEHYHHSSIVQMINSYEECFRLLVESSGAQLLRMPTNLILEILKQRESLQHQCIMLRRKLYQLDRTQEELQKIE